MMDRGTRRRWYDAELARMALQAANTNAALAPRPTGADPHRATVALSVAVGLLGLVNLIV